MIDETTHNTLMRIFGEADSPAELKMRFAVNNLNYPSSSEWHFVKYVFSIMRTYTTTRKFKVNWDKYLTQNVDKIVTRDMIMTWIHDYIERKLSSKGIQYLLLRKWLSRHSLGDLFREYKPHRPKQESKV